MGISSPATRSIEEFFLKRLRQLERGDLALLRRNAGLRLADARGVLGLFYRLLPVERKFEEEIYFLVATLYALNDNPMDKGNLGSSMARMKAVDDRSSVDRRMVILLDSDFERTRYGLEPGELGFRLRQAVRLLASKGVGVNWEQLLKDLLRWSHPEKTVQKAWARAYFSPRSDTGKEDSHVD